MRSYATPSWDQTLPANTRFVVLSNFNDQAVLDRETGLVWERTQQVPTNTLTGTEALEECALVATGGRSGWRLSTIAELTSLFDPTVPSPSLALPAGNPFMGVTTNAEFWSTTLRSLPGATLPRGTRSTIAFT
jgi:hypothetical protein